jgi:hypothetical protein
MTTDTNLSLSRRRLLASSLPAAAAAMASAAATALCRLPMDDDAELLALKPEFDKVFDEWWQQHLKWEAHTKAFEAELERRAGMIRAQAWKHLENHNPEWDAYHATMDALIKEDIDPNHGASTTKR